MDIPKRNIWKFSEVKVDFMPVETFSGSTSKFYKKEFQHAIGILLRSSRDSCILYLLTFSFPTTGRESASTRIPETCKWIFLVCSTLLVDKNFDLLKWAIVLTHRTKFIKTYNPCMILLLFPAMVYQINAKRDVWNITNEKPTLHYISLAP